MCFKFTSNHLACKQEMRCVLILWAGVYKNVSEKLGKNSRLVPAQICSLAPCKLPQKNIKKFRNHVMSYFTSLLDDISDVLHILQLVQVGVGLMLLQQFSGVNAVAYYASTIFVDAGNQKLFKIALCVLEYNITESMILIFCLLADFSSSTGTITLAIIGVHKPQIYK